MMKKEELTQEEKVLRHIKKYGSISTYDAFKHYNITRLSAKIYNLIHNQGINIKSEYRTNKKTGCNYKVYYLDERKIRK